MINLRIQTIIIISIVFMSAGVLQADTALIDVNVRFDRKFDFSTLTDKYRWVKRKDSSRAYYASVDPEINEYFLSLVNKKLSEKGYTEIYDDSASFGIDYEVIIKSEGTESSLADYSAEIRKSRYSKTFIASLPDIENTKEGTIILNIMDLESGYLIWIGYAEAIVADKENREELLQKAVALMFEEFPPK